MRMTLFGQSAGASSTDFFAYAWWNNPLVQGLIIQSGAVGNNKVTYSEGTSNFSYVAGQVGCGSQNKDEELRCMQSVDAERILQVYEKYNASENGGKSLGFGASVDEETIFSNFSERRDRGLVAKIVRETIRSCDVDVGLTQCSLWSSVIRKTSTRRCTLRSRSKDRIRQR